MWAASRQPRVKAFDLVIAATARVHGAAVLTHNVRDFGGLEGVVEVRPAG